MKLVTSLLQVLAISMCFSTYKQTESEWVTIICSVLEGSICQGRPAILKDVGCHPRSSFLWFKVKSITLGSGNYDTFDFSTPLGTIFAAEAIYMEGSDACTSELKAWHDANTAAITAYVQNGVWTCHQRARQLVFLCFGNLSCPPEFQLVCCRWPSFCAFFQWPIGDGVGTDSCTAIAAKKRLGSNNSGTVTVNVAGGGDPYFLGMLFIYFVTFIFKH
jgi:hypothetical protein